MAVGDLQFYTTGLDKLTNGFSWASGDVRVLLVTSSYTFDPEHNDVADITNELSGGNYARLVIGNKVRTKNTTDHRIQYTADPAIFPLLGLAAGTPTKIVFFDQAGGADANRELLAAMTLTGTAPNGTDYTVVFPSGLVFYIGRTTTYTP